MGRYVRVVAVMVATLAVLAACGGARGRGAGAGGGDRGCLPAAGASTYRLVNVDGRTHVCSERRVADGGDAHHACWLVVDFATGAVRPSDVVVEPGRGREVPAELTEAGLCAQGYCVKDPPLVGRGFGGGGMTWETEKAILSQHTVGLAIGDNIAIVITEGTPPTGEPFFLFDAEKRLRPLAGGAGASPMVDEPAPSPGATEALIVDDTIFLASYDAGPHAQIHVYAGDGRSLGPVTDPTVVDEYAGDYELWNGSVSVVSDYEVAFAEHLLQRVLVFHTREKKVTVVWRRQSETPALCTKEMRDIYFDPVEVSLEFAMEENRVSPVCKQTLDDQDGRFGPYGLARNAEGALVALAKSGDTHVLVTFDDGGGIVREAPIAVCEVAVEATAS
jgi:hypothetical protein